MQSIYVFLTVSIIASTISAQSTIYTFNGDATGDNFGISEDGIGDINLDGYPDVIVGANLDDNSGADSGSARVFSGKNGTALYTFNGDSAGDNFGISVGGVGDVDLDGYPDVIVGANLDDNSGADSGSVRVFSGKNGTVLQTANGNAAGNKLRVVTKVVGDLTGDGLPDIILGAPCADVDPDGTPSTGDEMADAGRIVVLSGKDGTIICEIDGHSAGEKFGAAIDAGQDLTGDGCSDFIVGAPCYSAGPDGILNNGDDIPNAGRAYVYSGKKDGNGNIVQLFTINGDTIGGRLGATIAFGKDLNADGIPEYVIGAPGSNNNGAGSGTVYIISSTSLPLTTNVHELSLSVADSQTMNIDSGAINGLKNYWLFTGFAASGDTPGVTMAPGVVIPLNQPDPITSFVINLTQLGGGGPTFVGWKGTLDVFGKASSSLNTFGSTPAPLGITLHHVALIYTSDGCGVGCDTFQLATNWAPVTTVP